MKWIVVAITLNQFAVYADDGVNLKQAREYGKDCIFSDLSVAWNKAEEFNKLYRKEGK